jgi:hypothetical protein
LDKHLLEVGDDSAELNEVLVDLLPPLPLLNDVVLRIDGSHALIALLGGSKLYTRSGSKQPMAATAGTPSWPGGAGATPKFQPTGWSDTMWRRKRPIWDGICDVLTEGGVGRMLMARSGGAVGVRGSGAVRRARSRVRGQRARAVGAS